MMKFSMNERNPGYAEDPGVIRFGGRYLMYYSVPPCEGKNGWGIAIAESSDLLNWKYLCEIPHDGSILAPELPWEQECIEAPAACIHNDKIYMFYAGACNNCPQQIGCAVSSDGRQYPFFRETTTMEKPGISPAKKSSGREICQH